MVTAISLGRQTMASWKQSKAIMRRLNSKLTSSLLTILLSITALLVASCTSTQRLGTLPDNTTIEITPVKNLSGVTLQVPEFYIGDAVGSASSVEQDYLDLTLLTQAALISGLRQRGYQADTENTEYNIHAAITEFNSKNLRKEGWLTLGLTILIINSSGEEITRGEAVLRYQLFTEGPDQLGVLGEQRFVAKRIKAFTETLTNQALQNAGLG